MKIKRPFGTWPSVISAEIVASAAPKLSCIQSHQDQLFWVESRPQESGRNVIVSQDKKGITRDILPAPYSHASRVHEYGGMAYALSEDTLYFVNAVDQCIYKLAIDGSQFPTAIPQPGSRFADLAIDTANNRLIAVCEQHKDNGEPENFLAGISLDKGSQQLQRLASGADFYAYPCISPNGKKLCWIEWNHPNMPWDSTQLCCADNQSKLSNQYVVAGAEANEAIFQPRWSPDNQLFYVSDRNNWWNIYSAKSGVILDRPAEFATPLWQFGMSTYDFIDADRIGCLWTQQGIWHCGILHIATGHLEIIETDFTAMQAACCHQGELAMIAGASDRANQIVTVGPKTAPTKVHTPACLDLELGNLSSPESIYFPTANNQQVQAFFYTPTHSQFQGMDNELPPIIVICHGGPTGATDCSLNLKIQYWTNRGFAVVDINYRGSTGFGRDYRNALNNAWGVADIEDTQYAVNYLVKQKKVDAERCIIRGSSAGGYTVLSALTFTDTFKAGASLYGIGNLETLATDTHKFESRYLDKLVGCYPEQQKTYYQRSPINHIDRLNCPVIFLQGLEDKVVPPNQAKLMVNSLEEKGIDVVYIEFPDEGHGFRKSENIIRAMQAELTFYLDVFNLSNGK